VDSNIYRQQIVGQLEESRKSENIQPESSAFAWYAVYTRARHEAAVTKQIAHLGYKPFFPKRRILSRRKDRRKIIEAPLFPGYVFAKVTPTDFNKLLSLSGAVKLLGDKGRPAPIPEEEIESVKILVQSEAEIEPHPYLREGDKVRIVSGPLKDAVGWLLRVEPRRSLLVVSVNILNRSVAIELGDDVVEKY
jgi:transcription antitermination factor NusG